MGIHSARGFTIIETMLFLAISGILIISMVAGTGATINIQRYRDATETFKALLQSQYSALSSVENDRENTWNCGAQAQTESGGSEIRGQSDCFLLGRYVTIDQKDIKAYSVVGIKSTGLQTVGGDIIKLHDNYILNVSTVNIDTHELEWGTQLAWPKAGTGSHSATTPRSIGILFIRSPDSGQIYTFTSDTISTSPTPQVLKDTIVAGTTVPGQSSRTLCINSGGLFVTDDQSIYISDYANGPSSIESQSNSYIANPTSPRDHTIQC